MEKREFCAKLIKLLYEVEPAGGNLHIVLDDLNVEDEHLLFCAKQLEGKHQEKTDKGEYQVYLEMAIAMYLSDMPVEERAEFIQKAKREDSFTDRDVATEMLARCGETMLLSKAILLCGRMLLCERMFPLDFSCLDLSTVHVILNTPGRVYFQFEQEPRRLIYDKDFGWGWYNSEGPEE